MPDFAVIDRAQLAESQEAPETTVNEAIDDAIRMLTQKASITVSTNTVDASVASDDNTSNYRVYLRNLFLKFTGGPGGSPSDVSYLVPAAGSRLFIVENNMASSALTVKVSGQTGVKVPSGAKMLLLNNGTDVELVNDLTRRLGIYKNAVMTSSEELIALVAPWAFTIKAGLPGWKARAGVAPSGGSPSGDTVTFHKNGGAAFASVRFLGTDLFTFTCASDTSFAEGDVLTAVAPASPDSALRQIAITGLLVL